MCSFPLDEAIRKKWIDFVSSEHGVPYIPPKDARLCSLHFDADNYIGDRPKFRGIPTVSAKKFVFVLQYFDCSYEVTYLKN